MVGTAAGLVEVSQGLNSLMQAVIPAARRLGLVLRATAYTLRWGPVTDVDRFILNLAERHVREGRVDLAEEDLLWLGRWYEA